MELSIIDIKGKDTGKKVKLSEEIFGIEPNDHAIYLDVKQYLANQRQGTHKAKERAEVAFSTRKLKKQKGTGGARAGSRKSPVFVGGGTIFGPRPRNYSFKLNKKLKSLARRSALAHKAKSNSLSVLQDFSFAEPKTKEFLNLLANLKLEGNKSLFVISDLDKNVYLSSRNISRTKVVVASDVNTYDLLHADQLLFTEGAIKKIEDLLS
jgi:large subunit ribosomal protein L4